MSPLRRPAEAVLALAALLTLAPSGVLLAAPAAGASFGSRSERNVSMWVGLAGADGTDVTLRPAGAASTAVDSDFGPFLLGGVRIEVYPAPAAKVARHFGFGFEAFYMIGEADLGTGPGGSAEEVTFDAAVFTPSFVARFQGESWEYYVGAGATVIWWANLEDLGDAGDNPDGEDAELPLKPALYMGLRRNHPARWFVQFEARWLGGETDHDLTVPRAELDVDWASTQVTVGTGYRF